MGLPSRIRWAGACVILGIIGVRVITEHARIPWWDFDPLIAPVPESRITPALSMAMDALVLACAAAILIAGAIERRRTAILPWLAAFVGISGVILHGFILRPYGGAVNLHGDLRSFTIGATWSAAIVGALALWAAACADRRVRAVITGVLLGAAAPVIATGIVQVVIEHPQMVRAFDADPTSALQAAGITPGTPAAASFNRRLRQAEATGAFGLANVYGTVVAASAAFWAVIGFGAIRARTPRAIALAAIGLAASLIGLWMCGSKGAAAAGAFGICVVAMAAWIAHRAWSRPWMGRALGVSAVVVPLAAVVARGAIGERIGELSLLFRWHYTQAAARIIGDYPVFGVGPGNFKSAYLLAKNPLNPEQVESPHSVILDWISQLGLFGVAWAVLAITAAGALGAAVFALGGRRFTTESAEATEGKNREETETREGNGKLACIIVPVLAATVSLWISRETMAPERALALAIGLALWVAIALWIASATRLHAWIAAGAAAAGAVALAHGQIEVTPVMAGSAAWWAAVVGVGAASPGAGRGGRWLAGIGAVVLVGGAVAIAARIPKVATWEYWLHETWKMIGSSAENPVWDAGHGLHTAWTEEPSFIEVGTLSSRLLFQEGSESGRRRSSIAAGFVIDAYPGRVDGWVAMANVRATVHGPGSTAALGPLVKAFELDPWSVTLPVRIAEGYAAIPDPEEAARWARKALENDAWLRLDPVVRMDPATRARMEALAGAQPENAPRGNKP